MIGLAGIAGGLRIITDIRMTDPYEDWSEVRSIGRATRRRAQGKPQRIKMREKPSSKVYRMGDTLVMHPEMRRQLEAATLSPRPAVGAQTKEAK